MTIILNNEKGRRGVNGERSRDKNSGGRERQRMKTIEEVCIYFIVLCIIGLSIILINNEDKR